MTPAQRDAILDELKSLIDRHEWMHMCSAGNKFGGTEDYTLKETSKDIMRLARAILVMLPEPTKEDVNG